MSRGRTVDIEFIGDPPMLDEVAKARIALGEIPSSAATILRSAEAQRTTAIRGIDRRLVEPEYFGTSKKYVFGPDVFVVGVDATDVDKILGSAAGHQFRRVGAPENEIIRPAANFVIVSEDEITPQQLRSSLA